MYFNREWEEDAVMIILDFDFALIPPLLFWNILTQSMDESVSWKLPCLCLHFYYDIKLLV